MGRHENEYEHEKVMISMNSSVLRKWAHPLNFFAGFAGSMNSDGESPCENRESAHRTYLFVNLLFSIARFPFCRAIYTRGYRVGNIPSILDA
jgi:hypothetical protein